MRRKLKIIAIPIVVLISHCLHAQQIISTVAGSGPGGLYGGAKGFSGDNGPAVNARFDLLGGLVVDGAGNLYIADAGNNRIRRVDGVTGIITTVAGNGNVGYNGDGLLGTNTSLFNPSDVVIDGQGVLYIADHNNGLIRSGFPYGTLMIVAGVPFALNTGELGDYGPATSASLSAWDVAIDKQGNLYISGDNRVRTVDYSHGIITTVAGTGVYGDSGDNGPAINAKLSAVNSVATDNAGNIYLADYPANRIRKVNIASGIITTVAGDGTAGFSGDNGLAINAQLNDPHGVAVDKFGNIYIADTRNMRIRKVNASTGIITTLAGSFGFGGFAGDGGPAINALLDNPVKLALDDAGNLFFSDLANYRIRKVTNATKDNQSITFNSLSSVAFGDAPFQAGASASSGLAISYTSSNTSVATVSGNIITIVGVGSTSITANQAGNDSFIPATSVARSLTVNKGNQAIQFNALTPATFGAPSIVLNGSSNSGLPLTYTSSNSAVASISGNIIAIQAAGVATITASQNGNANYNAAGPVQQTFTVNQANQTIVFSPISPVSYGSAVLSLTGSATSGLTVNYTSSNPLVATISGSSINVVGAGSSTITAFQPGNGNFKAATAVPQTLTVTKANQAITFNSLAPATYGGSPITLTAAASSGLPISYQSNNPSVATVTGNSVAIMGAGAATITASQPGNTNFLPAVDVVQSLVINKSGSNTITFSPIADKTLGDPDFTPMVSASSALPVILSTSSDKILIHDGQVSLRKPGRAAISADQPGNANVNSAPSVTRGFCIFPTTPTITATGLGTEHVVLTSSSNDGNQWYLNGSPIDGAIDNTLTIAGPGGYTVSVTADDCTSMPSQNLVLTITGVVPSEDGQLIVYPVPAGNEITLQLNGFSAGQVVDVSIHDAAGRQIEFQRGVGGQSMTINITGYSGGKYLVRATQGPATTSKQFIKE